RGLNARALDAYQAALAAWTAPPPTPDTRRATAAALLADARRDLRAALAGAPTNPFLHSSLAWVEATDAVVHDRHDAAALAPALTRAGQRRAAAAELEPAVAAEPANPELQRALGEALARAGDPAALDHLRLALAASERPSGAVARGPFAARDPGLDAWIRRRAGHDLADTSRYRRVLARYLLERGLWDQAAAAWERLAADAP